MQYFISYQQLIISGAEPERLSVGLQWLSINILRDSLKIAFMIGTGMITLLIYHCNSSLAQMPKWQFPLQMSEFAVEDSFLSLEGGEGLSALVSQFVVG